MLVLAMMPVQIHASMKAAEVYETYFLGSIGSYQSDSAINGQFCDVFAPACKHASLQAGHFPAYLGLYLGSIMSVPEIQDQRSQS